MRKTTAVLIGGLLLLVSFATAQTLISTSLASINGQYDLVYGWNSTSTSFKFYRPGGNPASNSLNYTSVMYGYWVNVNASSATLNVTGTEPSSTSISVVSGWNLIGYPKTATQLLSTTLTGINGQYDLVYGWNSTSTSFKFYRPGGNPASNSLNYSVAGNGYWLNVNVSSVTLTIT